MTGQRILWEFVWIDSKSEIRYISVISNLKIGIFSATTEELLLCLYNKKMTDFFLQIKNISLQKSKIARNENEKEKKT